MNNILRLILLSFVSFASLSVYAQKKNNTKIISEIIGDREVILKVEIEYFVNKKGVLKNDQYVEYTITNVSEVQYNGTAPAAKNAIVFDLTTKDGKTMEKSIPFREELSPRKSTVIKYFIADVGPKRSCIGAKASRLDHSSL